MNPVLTLSGKNRILYWDNPIPREPYYIRFPWSETEVIY